ncbi:MAG: DUF1926 domain-containing protein [Pseudomonadota bacterium]|nr:DUF1926 domain-containing protein [Pseudomonadota bacterium]
MSEPVHLLFGVHMHQPAGNFAEVMHHAHERCYRPFFETLWNYPEFRFALHVSGWLLDWLAQQYPEDVQRIRQMVERGQIELFGGGDCEPVLAVIPYRDRLSQLGTLSDRLEKTLGARPVGAWLTERVWEATVVPALSESGIFYTAVDDYHFLCSGLDLQKLDGYYTTEEDGHVLNLFPISQELRYKIPFSQPELAISAVSKLAQEHVAAAVYFDDIEKFGIWPQTWQWVYGEKWLNRFIEGILAHPNIRVSHYFDYIRQDSSRGIVYLPTTSYIEMNEWTLSKEHADRFNDLVEALRKSGIYDIDKPFVRGGIWKNFFSRYPESNWMHKRMLGLSERVEKSSLRKTNPELTLLLHLSQTNDAYWHGLFGGLYLPHLRRLVFSSLIALEKKLETLKPAPNIEQNDWDLDGYVETRFHNPKLSIWIREDGAASIHELDVYELGHNLADTLRRQPEHYYRKMEQQGESGSHEGIASPHDRVSFKQLITSADMIADPFPRTSFRDSLSFSDKSVQPVMYLPVEFSRQGLEYRAESLRKYYHVSDNVLTVRYEFSPIQVEFNTVLNLSMPSCDGPGGRVIVHNEILGGFGLPHNLSLCKGLILEDEVLGGRIALRFSRPLSVSLTPFHTVSQSEAGFEKIMQALTVSLKTEVHDKEWVEIQLVFEKKSLGY